jgi:hypothetical protein
MDKQTPVNYHLIELANIENLSERVKNICLDNSIDSLFKLIDFYEEYGDFLSLRNCGKNSNEILVAVASKYIDKYDSTKEEIVENGNHEKFEELKMFCFGKYKLSTIETEQFRQAFLAKQFPYFKFILLILEKHLKEREFYIFENNFGFFENREKQTLQAIGNRFDITRERVRQISHNIPYRIRKILAPFADELFFITNSINYQLKTYKDYILIDNHTREQINQSEQLQLNTRFYAFGLAMLYQQNYYFFQEPLEKYKQYYLINKKLAEQFDFTEFYYDLLQKASVRIKKDYAIDFRHYVRSFYRPGKFSYFERIVDICKQIALGEFGYRCNINDELIVARNTKIKLSEHIYQIIEEKGRPMHLKEIAGELKARQLKMPPNVESLRSSILIIDSIKAIGKTSTYSLAKWDHVKTGTIKQLAIDYLQEREHPAQISEISKHINKYRKTLDKNVYSNLKLDRSGTFLFFRGGYVGLSSKNYTSKGSTNGQLTLL